MKVIGLELNHAAESPLPQSLSIRERRSFMRSLYATRLRIYDAAFEGVVEKLRDWVATYYAPDPEVGEPEFCRWAEQEGAEGTVMVSATWTPKKRHELDSELRRMNEQSLYEVNWKHPSDSPGVDQSQTIDISVLDIGEYVEFDLRSTLRADTFRLAPLDPGVIQRPRIVDRIVHGHGCRIGQSRMFSYPQRINESTVHSFLQDTLTDPNRAVPVVLVSHHPERGRPVRDPEWVQDRLLGLAIVAEVAPSAEEPLTAEVGRSRSCVEGQVRLYWPGFTSTSVPKKHPYFSASYIEEKRAEGTDLEDILFERITRVASERHRQSRELQSFRRQFRQTRREELLQAADETGDELPEDWRREYEETLDENERLQRRVEALDKELQDAKENLRAAYRQASTLEKSEEGDTMSRQEVSTLIEALHFAEEQFGEQIYVWKRAWTAAENAQYHDPPEVVYVLEAVANLAKEYEEEDGAVGPWREHFQERGIKFTRHESESTMNQYGEHRQFHDGERQATMQTHVTVGQGHEHCLQIYFDRLEGDPRFQIGYCGEHLPYASENT